MGQSGAIIKTPSVTCTLPTYHVHGVKEIYSVCKLLRTEPALMTGRDRLTGGRGGWDKTNKRKDGAEV